MAIQKALEGIKVVDFGVMGVNPVGCRHLADYGATVVRIESHRAPDAIRFTPPYYKQHVDGSMFFGNYNTSKFSITLDFAKPTGIDICWRLIKWADVVACGRPARWMLDWGLDYESVKKVKPDIIYYIPSNVGLPGPDSALFGMGAVSTALMGVQHLTGWLDRGPSNPAGFLGDSINYLFGPIAVLAALEYRDRTKKGQLIDLSQVETYLCSESPWLLDYTVNGRIASRSGNRYPLFADNAPYGAFPCRGRDGRDRWVAICITSDEEWQAFCKVIGQPEWTKQARFATAWGRRQHEDELEKLVSQWTECHTAAEVEAMMQTAGVPASVAESNRDLMEDPHLRERGYFRWLKHRELGVVPFSGPPFRLSKTPDTQFASPCMGEHNEYVTREILGLSEEEVNKA